MIHCDWIQIAIIIAIFLLVMGLCILAAKRSKRKNCCNSKDDFKNCKSYFGNSKVMDSDDSYKNICNNK